MHGYHEVQAMWGGDGRDILCAIFSTVSLVCLLYLIPSSIVLNFPSHPKPSRNKRATLAVQSNGETKTREHVGSMGMRSRLSRLLSAGSRRATRLPSQRARHGVRTRTRTTGVGSSALHRHGATRDKCAPHPQRYCSAIMLLHEGGLALFKSSKKYHIECFDTCME